jgi:hypothetical protein
MAGEEEPGENNTLNYLPFFASASLEPNPGLEVILMLVPVLTKFSAADEILEVKASLGEQRNISLRNSLDRFDVVPEISTEG